MTQTPCPLCNQLVDPIRHDHLIIPHPVIPRVHAQCMYSDGRSPDDLSHMGRCCVASHVLDTLGGHIVEASSKVPPWEIWVSLPAERKIHRFARGEDGLFVPVLGELPRE